MAEEDKVEPTLEAGANPAPAAAPASATDEAPPPPKSKKKTLHHYWRVGCSNWWRCWWLYVHAKSRSRQESGRSRGQ